ncbi:MAG TPA: RNA polymerase sigma factor [Thermoanaerobaculia bacterium]|nr:RNA polymerase sigma factor [Thermoanaerobaculia bacterium]
MDGVTALPKAGARQEALEPRLLTEAEFEALHARTSQPLWAYLRRISGDPALADDVLQESYLRLLRHPPAPDRDERERKAYLFQIATNLMRDRWRAKERERSVLERLVSLWPARSERSGAALPLDMEAALERLKPRERSLLWLAYVEGYDHREIANVLSLQEGSVRVMLFRARRKLEKELV